VSKPEDNTVRALEALIAAELIAPDATALHIDAVGRAIDGSGLPLVSRMELRHELAQRAQASIDTH
jgi:hypothetical protein